MTKYVLDDDGILEILNERSETDETWEFLDEEDNLEVEESNHDSNADPECLPAEELNDI